MTICHQAPINTRIFIGLFCFASCVQLSCIANNPVPKKTAMLKPIEGYTGELIGAEVTQVNPMPDENMVEIVVEVPQDLNDVESVNIVDQQDKKVETAKSFEFSKDADGEPNGVIIYLKKSRRLPFRLKFSTEQP